MRYALSNPADGPYEGTMRNLIVLSGMVLLTGCAPDAVRGPTSLAKAAEAGMWSSRSPKAVQACLADVEASAIAPETGQPLRFQVDPADPRKTRYKTIVTVFGDVSSNKPEAEAAASCL
jgi:hypothetical protein